MDNVTCPVCGSEEVMILGELGNLTHYRCRYCGMDFHIETPKISDDYPVTDDWGLIGMVEEE